MEKRRKYRTFDYDKRFGTNTSNDQIIINTRITN